MRSGKYTILTIALVIAAIGIASIYSTTYQDTGGTVQSHCRRQVFWVLLGTVIFLMVSRLNYRRLWDATHFLYAAAVLLLLLVFILGAVRLGAQRWLKIAWFNFQPSEIAKLIMVLFLARYYSTKGIAEFSLQVHRLGPVRSFIIPFLCVAFPMGLIVEQPDLGSGAILFLIFLAMTYLAGVRLKYLLGFMGLIVLSLPLFWHYLRDYQKDRLLVFLNPNIDPLGAGYTIIQSKIAIGSGGFFGRGWLSGTQSQLQFLPEAHTDFIFATFAEEWGFLGSAALLLLYFLLIRQGIKIAQRTNDNFGRLVAYGISFMLAVQVFINIAMNLGLAPVVGVPLYLMSYGGSSVVTTFIALGILANIDRTRSF